MTLVRTSFARLCRALGGQSLGICLTLLAATACSDRTATSPIQPNRASAVKAPPDHAALEAQINGLINALYAPTAQGAVFSAFARIKAALASGRTDDAQTGIVAFFSMVLQDWRGGQLQDPNGSQPPSTIEALQDLLNGVAQFGGLPAPIPSTSAFGAGGTVAVVGSSGGTVVTPSGFAGVRIPAGALPADVIVVVTRLPNPTQPRTGPLPTGLDQYPLFYDFSTFPHVQQFAQPVTVAICRLEVGDPFGPPNYTVADRLQIAHPNPANPVAIELLQRVETDFVHCDGVSLAVAAPAGQGQNLTARAAAVASAFGSAIAKFVLPTTAYAVHAGLGGKTTSFSPFGLVDPGGVTPLYGQLAVGNQHGCVITAAHQTWCWGDRTFGQLGNGVILTSPSIPVPVNGSPSYTTISSHGSHTCGMLAGGTAQCWGRNGSNLGSGISSFAIATPVNVLGGPYLQISGGRLTSCAIDVTNVAWCWGINQLGEVGNPAFAQPNGPQTPVMVATNLRFRSIEASWVHTCALVLDIHPVADTYCWGSGNALGTGTATIFPTPFLIGGGLKFSHLFAGGTATCGVTAILTAYCWGFNPSGGLGNGTTVDTPIPTPVAGSLSFVMLATGTRANSLLTHTCGITVNGVAYCWGANDLGQLGDGTTAGKLVPTPVATNERFVAIGAGDTFSCAMRADRTVFCWGDNNLGQLGSGLAGGISPTPVAVPLGGPPPAPAIGFADLTAGALPANLSALHGVITVTLFVNPPFGTTTSKVDIVSGTGTVLATQTLTTTQHTMPVLTIDTSNMPLGPGSLLARVFLVGSATPVLSASLPVNITP